MAFFLLELPDALNRRDGTFGFILEAADATEAKNLAAAFFTGDGDWQGATVTALSAGTLTTYAGFKYRVRAGGPAGTPDVIDSGLVALAATDIGVVSATIGATGAGYAANDRVRISGGVFSQAAEIQVLTVSAGAVSTFKVIHPGVYTTLPGSPAATTAITGGGSGATFNLTGGTATVDIMGAKLVQAIRALQKTAGTNTQYEPATRLLTVSAIADNLGDKTVVAEAFFIGAENPINASLIGAIVHQGIAGAVLTVTLVNPAAIPNIVRRIGR